MTEDEAKKKFCPLTLGRTPVPYGNQGAILHSGEGDLCLGSQCMAFRYKNTKDSGFCGMAEPVWQ